MSHQASTGYSGNDHGGESRQSHQWTHFRQSPPLPRSLFLAGIRNILLFLLADVLTVDVIRAFLYGNKRPKRFYQRTKARRDKRRRGRRFRRVVTDAVDTCVPRFVKSCLRNVSGTFWPAVQEKDPGGSKEGSITTPLPTLTSAGRAQITSVAHSNGPQDVSGHT